MRDSVTPTHRATIDMNEGNDDTGHDGSPIFISMTAPPHVFFRDG